MLGKSGDVFFLEEKKRGRSRLADCAESPGKGFHYLSKRGAEQNAMGEKGEEGWGNYITWKGDFISCKEGGEKAGEKFIFGNRDRADLREQEKRKGGHPTIGRMFIGEKKRGTMFSWKSKEKG